MPGDSVGSGGGHVKKSAAALANLHPLVPVTHSGGWDRHEATVANPPDDWNHHPTEGGEPSFATPLNYGVQALRQLPDLLVESFRRRLGIDVEMFHLNRIEPGFFQERGFLKVKILNLQEEHELRIHGLLSFVFQEFQEFLRGGDALKFTRDLWVLCELGNLPEHG